jgi:phosphatidate cytidylyltransferase
VWYAGAPLGFISALHRQPHGDRLTFGVLLLVVIADVMALATGVGLGQFLPYKPAKIISPNKTLIGMIGGFTSPLLVGSLLLDGSFVPAHTGWYLGGLIGVFAQVGDILASALKRSVDIKDYASRLPGHGGLMDRADSAGPGALTAWCYLAPWLHLIPASFIYVGWR